MRHWPARRWYTAAAAAVATVLVIAIPTDLINTPVFGREVPPTWWSWPVLIVTAALSGLLLATYVAIPSTEGSASGAGGAGDAGREGKDPQAKRGIIGAALTYFAVGCPVCNKIALLLLGTSGALTWFAPLQPILALLALVLLGEALRRRLAGERSCPVAVRADAG